PRPCCRASSGIRNLLPSRGPAVLNAPSTASRGSTALGCGGEKPSMLHRQLLGVLALLTAMVVAAGVGSAATGGDPVRGYLSEVRGGGLAHDVGVFGRSEEDGVDVNVELLFVSPDFLKPIWAPRPHIGASVSTSGETSQAYFGLT